MKKLNKKGFTLVELLAVVVILLAISVIAVSSISAAIERNKNKQNESKIEILESYARLYYDKYKNNMGNEGKIELGKLQEVGATDDDLTDVDGNNFNGCIKYDSGNFEYTEEGCSAS